MGGNLTGGEMKVYVGIDMAKDKFDYCASDSDTQVICTGKNLFNNNEEFRKLSELLTTLKGPGKILMIGMESTGIYHIPLYNYLTDSGFHIRILNGLEVRGMKKSRVRKTSNDIIDAQSIARYLMVTETKESYLFPGDLENLKELITAYDIITCKIRTTKNNVIRVMDMLFRGLSNLVEIDGDTIELLEKFRTPEDFKNADQNDLLNHVSKRRAGCSSLQRSMGIFRLSPLNKEATLFPIRVSKQ